jgi:hypothetical protein
MSSVLSIRCGLVALVVTLAAWLPAAAGASGETARISAALVPERLGAPTAISLHFKVAASRGAVPAPVSGIDVLLPPNLGIATSGLGIASCDPTALEALGPAVCPRNSRMGSGSATVEIPIGPEVRQEHVQLTLFAGPSPDGYLRILIYAIGEFPVEAQIVLTSVLLPGRLAITVPLVPSLPGGPDVSLVDMRATIGGNLTYVERVHGRTAAYHPRGIGLPTRCPRTGFPFGAMFSFVDGGRVPAHTAVACPRATRARRVSASSVARVLFRTPLSLRP